MVNVGKYTIPMEHLGSLKRPLFVAKLSCMSKVLVRLTNPGGRLQEFKTPLVEEGKSHHPKNPRLDPSMEG